MLDETDSKDYKTCTTQLTFKVPSKVIGVQSNHGVEYFGGPASPRLFAVEGTQRAKRAVGKGL